MTKEERILAKMKKDQAILDRQIKKEKRILAKMKKDQAILDRQIKKEKEERERLIREAEERRRKTIQPETLINPARIQKLKELAEETRKREDWLARMEAMPDPPKPTTVITGLKKTAPFIALCKVCFEPIRYNDHGICRKCRSRISRCQENEKIRKQLVEFKTFTTQSVEVDSLIRYTFPPAKRID